MNGTRFKIAVGVFVCTFFNLQLHLFYDSGQKKPQSKVPAVVLWFSYSRLNFHRRIT